jgi:uncharacterized protein with PhoU and TrkA domain
MSVNMEEERGEMEEVEDLFTELRKVSFLWVNLTVPLRVLFYTETYHTATETHRP